MTLKDGIPGWVYPAAITAYALMERLLAGLGYAHFMELANSPSNWLPEILGVSLGGFVLNKAQKGYMEAKKAASLAQYQSRAASSDDT